METNPNVAATKKATTPDAEKDKKSLSGSMLDKFRQLIEMARANDADPSQISHIRKMMYQYTNWHPTRKRVTKRFRIKKLKLQKKARRINQRRQKFQKSTKGQIKSGRV